MIRMADVRTDLEIIVLIEAWTLAARIAVSTCFPYFDLGAIQQTRHR